MGRIEAPAAVVASPSGTSVPPCVRTSMSGYSKREMKLPVGVKRASFDSGRDCKLSSDEKLSARPVLNNIDTLKKMQDQGPPRVVNCANGAKENQAPARKRQRVSRVTKYTLTGIARYEARVPTGGERVLLVLDKYDDKEVVCVEVCPESEKIGNIMESKSLPQLVRIIKEGKLIAAWMQSDATKEHHAHRRSIMVQHVA